MSSPASRASASPRRPGANALRSAAVRASTSSASVANRSGSQRMRSIPAWLETRIASAAWNSPRSARLAARTSAPPAPTARRPRARPPRSHASRRRRARPQRVSRPAPTALPRSSCRGRRRSSRPSPAGRPRCCRPPGPRPWSAPSAACGSAAASSRSRPLRAPRAGFPRPVRAGPPASRTRRSAPRGRGGPALGSRDHLRAAQRLQQPIGEEEEDAPRLPSSRPAHRAYAGATTAARIRAFTAAMRATTATAAPSRRASSSATPTANRTASATIPGKR